MTNLTAHNSLTGETIKADDMGQALVHIGNHVHVTREDGFSASPMDLDRGKAVKVTFWASLTGQVRHRVMTGRCKGKVAGWIRRDS